MNALHRLAGVQETSDSTTQHQAPVPRISNRPPAPPIPRDSTDDADTRSQRRVSLPLHRKRSHKSIRSHHSKRSIASRRGSREANYPSHYPPPPALPPQNGDHAAAQPSDNAADPSADDESEEFVWGPSHPCFPHPNPHCSPSSPEFATTRVIRVRRDWLAAGDLYPQFANLFPEILDPLVTDEEFRHLVGTLNALLREAFDPYATRAWVDSLLGAFTGYLWEDLGLTGAKSGEKAVERFIQRWNGERKREGREVRLVQGRTTGYMSLDFIVPDPEIDLPVEDEEGDEEQGLEEALRGGDGQGQAE